MDTVHPVFAEYGLSTIRLPSTKSENNAVKQRWRAETYSQNMYPIVWRDGAIFTVHDVHERACNLISTSGDFVALITTDLGCGPFHITVPPTTIDHLRRGDRLVSRKAQYLVWRENQLDLTVAQSWSPSVKWSPVVLSESLLSGLSSIADALSLADILATINSTSSASQKRMQTQIQHGASLLRLGISNSKLSLVSEGAGMLAGLGPGLTPLGDDLLVGFMAGLWLLESSCGAVGSAQPSNFSAFRRAIYDAAWGRTTGLSSVWLKCAAQNHFDLTWHHLAEALKREEWAPIAKAISALASKGATSGVAGLYGLLTSATLQFPNGSYVLERQMVAVVHPGLKPEGEEDGAG